MRSRVAAKSPSVRTRSPTLATMRAACSGDKPAAGAPASGAGGVIAEPLQPTRSVAVVKTIAARPRSLENIGAGVAFLRALGTPRLTPVGLRKSGWPLGPPQKWLAP